MSLSDEDEDYCPDCGELDEDCMCDEENFEP